MPILDRSKLLWIVATLAWGCADTDDDDSTEDAASNENEVDAFNPGYHFDECERNPDSPACRDAALQDAALQDAALQDSAEIQDANDADAHDASSDGSSTDAEADADAAQNCEGEHRIWNNKEGKCTCEDGWINLANDTCQDIDECAGDNSLCKFAHGKCKNIPGSYRCECNSPLYQISREGDQCLDVDECAQDGNLCPNGRCSNLDATQSETTLGYECLCNTGYVLNTTKDGCIDEDECAASTNPCGMALCENTDGGYECLCGDRGHYANGRCTCDDGWIFVEGLGCSPVDLVEVEAGTFLMGSSNGGTDERPMHAVSLKRFFMSKSEVTNGEYNQCVQAGSCTAAQYGNCECPNNNLSGFQNDNQPVVCVTWTQASQFAEWAEARLPTEAEWEYAARGTDAKPYPWGNEEPTCDRAIMKSGTAETTMGCGQKRTWNRCATFPTDGSEAFCDLIGNAAEWVQDHYNLSYSGAPTDGSEFINDNSNLRVRRGGSWDKGNATGLLSGSARDKAAEDHYDCITGFRVVHPIP